MTLPPAAGVPAFRTEVAAANMRAALKRRGPHR